MAQIYRFETDGVKCGFCNYRTYDHYLIGDDRDEAREIGKHDTYDDVELKGFCAQCLIDEVINNRRRDVGPNYYLTTDE